MTSIDRFPVTIDGVPCHVVRASDYDRDTQRLSDESHRNRVDLVDAVERSDRIKAERDKLRAQVEAMRDLLAEQMTWHQARDKELSKSGRSDGDYHWRRLDHQEQISLIDSVLQAKP